MPSLKKSGRSRKRDIILYSIIIGFALIALIVSFGLKFYFERYPSKYRRLTEPVVRAQKKRILERRFERINPLLDEYTLTEEFWKSLEKVEENERRALFEVKKLKKQADKLLGSKNFVGLEMWLDKLRTSQETLPTGALKIDHIYSWWLSIIDPSKADMFESLLDKWSEAAPEAVTPHILRADFYVNKAWKERGHKTIDEVTKEGYQGYQLFLKKAQKSIKDAEKLDKTDPYLYFTKMSAHMNEPDAPRILKETFEEGVQVAPGYLRLYQARANHLLPRWFGRPGDCVALAEWAAEWTFDSLGDGLYAVVASNVARHNRLEDIALYHNFSWPRIAKGYQDLNQVYPLTYYEAHEMCRLAAAHGDYKTTSRILKTIGDKHWKRVWPEREFREVKEWVREKMASESGR